jgi:hypothetical protein
MTPSTSASRTAGAADADGSQPELASQVTLRDCTYDRTLARICRVHVGQVVISSAVLNAFQNEGISTPAISTGMDAVGEISHTVHCSRRESSPELISKSQRVKYILVIRPCVKESVSPRAEIANRVGDA